MKSNSHFLANITLAACMMLFIEASLEAQSAGYEYDWVGGKPGYSGTIFLDAPSYASAPNGGTVADILAGSYLTTPLGTYSVLDAADSWGVASWVPNLLWDQKKITAIFAMFQPTDPILDPSFYLPSVAVAQVQWFGAGNEIEVGSMPFPRTFETDFGNDDLTGQWLAVPVPEPSTLALAGFGAALSLCFRSKKVS